MLTLSRRNLKDCSQTEGVRYVMGTLLKVAVTAEHPDAAGQAKDRIFADMQDFENRWSAYKPASEISRINRRAGHSPLHVNYETVQVLERALFFAAKTRGACDPTVGPLMRLWGFTKERGHLPSEQEIERARVLVDYRLVRLDRTAQTVFLPRRGMRLDLGWIGKGFAMDLARDRAIAIPSLLSIALDFGGQLLFWDRCKSPRRRVTVETACSSGVEIPSFDMHGNGSVSTTSNAERYVLLRDPKTGAFRRVGHILDPRTGTPADRFESVTVMARTAADADALSTALFVLGKSGLPILRDVAGAQTFIQPKNQPPTLARA